VGASDEAARLGTEDQRGGIAVVMPTGVPLLSATAARLLASILRDARTALVVEFSNGRFSEEPGAVAS
jgi:hypothetical protein